MTLSRIKAFFASLAEPEPRRDWFFSLMGALILFLALLAYAAFVFFSIQSGTVFTDSVASVRPIPLTRGEVQDLLATYQARQVNYAARNLPAPPLVDPSK